MARSSTARAVRECVLSHGAAVDDETVDFICETARQTDIAQAEKTETISGVIALLESAQPIDSDGIAVALLSVIEAHGEDDDESEPEDAPREPVRRTQPSSPSEQDEQAVRRSIMREYGSVALDDEAEAGPADDDAMLQERLRQLDLKKKSRRKAEARLGGDMLQPNLNSAVVEEETRQKRSATAAQTKAKQERDKADLAKQRADQAKRKADARARAQKGERRA